MLTLSRTPLAASLAAAFALLAACGGRNDDNTKLDVNALSSRPELVTGGDVLVRVGVPSDRETSRVTVRANGRDLTSTFRQDPAGGGLIGLVTGLQDGANTITASYDGSDSGSLSVTNYPITGPVVSGPHESPFACTTTTFVPFAGTPALGAPTDANCSIPTRVQYVYRTTADTFSPLAVPTDRPANLATVTVEGRTVPYIVRLETGTINRAIYQTAILHDPVNDPQVGPTTAPAGWNRKLIYPLGGGCQGGWYTQGGSIVAPVNHSYLSKGFAVAVATLNTFGNNCNDLLSSETILMVKERFVESYGPPLFTIGTGGSGGAYQSNQTADNYPGTFDGIVTTSSFPDVTTGMIVLGDARLLDVYFNVTRAGQYTEAQRQAISGFSQVAEIEFLSGRTINSGSARRMDPRVAFPTAIMTGVGPQFRYDPVSNPFGARGTVYDHTINVYGRIPDTPVSGSARFAQRPLDNVGVQYGLKALNDGAITVAQFVDLNRSIGGFDIDLNHVPTRTTAYLDATRRAYQGGRILNGGNGLATIPIITRTGYGDAVVTGDIHLKFWAYAVRERLLKANGRADNQVIVSHTAPVDSLIDQMDRWLTAIESDSSSRAAIEKVVANKPADVVDACFTATGTKIVETQTAFGASQCNTLFPTSSAPILVAGAPIAVDIIKCQLKPVAASDYTVPVSAAELTEIRSVFPMGVCDYSKPGVEQTKSTPWASFGPSPMNLIFDITKP